MEIQFTSYTSEINVPEDESTSSIGLDKMIAKLISRFQPFSVLNGSFIINDVPAGFYVDADKNLLATVISHLFSAMISKTKNSCIRISAKRYNNIILLRMSDTTGFIHSINTHHWYEMRSMAEKLGGCIIIDDIRKKQSNITLSFRCLANVA